MFSTFLSQWYLNNPMAVQYGDVSVEDDLEVVYVAKSILKRVYLSHYNATKSESPVQTLDDLATAPSSVSRQCYEVRAEYVGAKKRKGVRGSVYRHAEEHEAYYSLDHSFYNDSNDLHISLLFCDEGKANMFTTFLSQWYLNNPMAVQYGDVSVEDDLEVVYVAKSILKRVRCIIQRKELIGFCRG